MTWQTEAEALCLTIVPELRVAYVVSSREVPEWLAGGTVGCSGWTSDLLDAMLSPQLKATGCWQGRGYCCVVGDTRLGRPMSPREKCEVTLHELAHHVESLAAGNVALSRTMEQLAPLVAPLPKPLSFSDDAAAPPWRKHGDGFIRAAAHIAHRASMAGFKATLRDLHVAGPAYRLSSPAAYFAALADEPRSREHEPILDVLRSPAPARFTALFARDTQAEAVAA